MDTKFDLVVYSDPCSIKNLAIDEMLFLKTISSGIPYIRIWEQPALAIYIGISQRWKKEVYQERCLKDRVPIIRRFSGGGAVIQHKGNINYTLTLPIGFFEACRNISKSYLFILNFLNDIFRPLGLSLDLFGYSDFCLNGYKVSGNSQARRKQVVLCHGTLLTVPHISLITHYLREPKVQPAYRKKKSHANFVSDLKSEGYTLDFQTFSHLIKESSYIEKNISLTDEDHALSDKYVQDKYSQNTWNFKF
ncbi:hypothetical protein AB834_00945 [PVC group bacterium (ex Bugula neritina AB1)]|nr:hypothetical protein AB834_00945 [PVC group bacterium (ex Bugula neritina AB1)]